MDETDAKPLPVDVEQKMVGDEGNSKISGDDSPDDSIGPVPSRTDAAPADVGSVEDPIEASGENQAEESAAAVTRMVRQTVQDELARLLRVVEDKIVHDTFRETQIDRLHDELQAYRSDIVAKALRPIFSAIIRLHGDSGRLVQSLRGEPPDRLSPDRLIRMFEDFGEDLERILRDNGVEPYTDQEHADRFNGRRQQAVGFVATPEEGQHAVVADRVRPGFAYGETILQKELVRVYKHEPAQSTPPPSNPPPSNT